MFGRSPIPFYLIIVNVYVFFLIWLDKRQLEKESWRIPNWQFLLIGLAGGGLGGLLGQAFLQHKTEKKRFMIIFQLGSIIAILLFGKAVGWLD